jgi:predicted Rossmann-fold nucleotide-binding protein
MEYLVEEGTIAPHDPDLVTYAETAEEIWDIVDSFPEDGGEKVLR